MRRRDHRREARVGDRRRRETAVNAGVVRRVECQLGLGQRARVVIQVVAQRRVDAERHPGAQAVVDDGRDQRAVARELRLALDHRGDDQHVVLGQARRARVREVELVEVLLEREQLLADQSRHALVRRRRRRSPGRGSPRARARSPAHRRCGGRSRPPCATRRCRSRSDPSPPSSAAIWRRVKPSGIVTLIVATTAAGWRRRASATRAPPSSSSRGAAVNVPATNLPRSPSSIARTSKKKPEETTPFGGQHVADLRARPPSRDRDLMLARSPSR